MDFARCSILDKNSRSQYTINGKDIQSHLLEFSDDDWGNTTRHIHFNSTEKKEQVKELCTNSDLQNDLSTLIKQTLLPKIFKENNTPELKQKFFLGNATQSVTAFITQTILEKNGLLPEYTQLSQCLPTTKVNVQIDQNGIEYQVTETLPAISATKKIDRERVILYYDAQQKKSIEMPDADYLEKFSRNNPHQSATIHFTLKVAPYQENKMSIELTEYHIESPDSRLQGLQKIADTFNPQSDAVVNKTFGY